MLGVLAIIGVLSVGGIAGYNLGIEKQRANELLAASLQRAYTVSSQILTGRNASLVEFEQNKDKAGGTFQTGVETGYVGKFGIQIQRVNQNVCKNLVRSITDTTPLRGVSFIGEQTNITEDDCQETNNLILFYNNDMGLTENSGSESGDTCPNGLFMCGEQCCEEGTYCIQGADSSTYTCVAPGEGDCTKNSDCKDAEGNVDTSKYCKLSADGCSGLTSGTCTDKGTLTSKTLNLPGGALTVYKGGTMNWWSASNLCQAHGKQMVTMADLGIAVSDTNTNCYFNSSYSSYATEPCICDGGSDSDCSATSAAIRTNAGALGTFGWLWLADNSKSSLCSARNVTLNTGRVSGSIRSSSYNALCR